MYISMNRASIFWFQRQRPTRTKAHTSAYMSFRFPIRWRLGGHWVSSCFTARRKRWDFQHPLWNQWASFPASNLLTPPRSPIFFPHQVQMCDDFLAVMGFMGFPFSPLRLSHPAPGGEAPEGPGPYYFPPLPNATTLCRRRPSPEREPFRSSL